jgi:glycosyltransferase involved in cell wall biosynthesis
MSVAIFTDNDFDKTNGVTTTLRALLRYAPPDVRTRVYTLSDTGLDRHDYLALRSLSAPIPYYAEMRMYVPRMRALARHLAADRVSLIHMTTPGPMGLAARYFASPALRLVGSFHTNLSEYTVLLSGSLQLGVVMGSYMRWLYGGCETVFVPSNDTRGRLLARQWPSDRLTIWRRGVDTETFSPARRSAALREAWGVSDRRPALVYVGRVSREKGLDLLPQIESILRCGATHYRLIVVGDGPMSSELRQRCPDAYFTGTLPHDEVATAMASSDVMVFPSETDTAGNVVLEAQSCGLPIVVSDAGGPRENIRHGETGFVCRSGDAIDFARRVGDYLRDQNWRAASARAARAFAGERSWQSALQPVYSLYRSIAGSAAPVTDAADAQMPATPHAV